MLARNKSYTLQSDTDFNVNVTVHPCCTIEIDLPEQGQFLRPQLEQIHFKMTHSGMALLVDENTQGCLTPQELRLAREDAMQLCLMIHEVIEEHEDLMSALC